LNNWLLVYPKIDEDRALIYVNMLRQVGQQQGMIINEPIHVQMEDDETETYANTLRMNLNEQVNDIPEKILNKFIRFRFNWYLWLLNHVELIVII
jgi:hypothetical protein